MRIVLMLVAVLFMVSCTSDGGQTKKMTVAEYAQVACFEDELSDDATWGDFRNGLDEAIKAYEEVNPPSELQEYHKAADALAKAGLKVVKDKPQSEIMNPFEMFGEEDLMMLGLAVGAVHEGLSPENQRILEAAGCD